jgi:Sec-independent protein secretion pathway component TatC
VVAVSLKKKNLISMIALVLPMVLLYEGAVLAVGLIEKSRATGENSISQ